MIRRRFFSAILLALGLLVSGKPALADDYPSRPITLIVPFPPGGGVDTIARVMGRSFRPRSASRSSSRTGPAPAPSSARAPPRRRPPDGYTLVMLTTGFTLPANTGYETHDFAPIGTISSTPIVIMSHPSLPANSLSDVIAMAKKEPGKLSAGSPPPPTLNYFAIELMKVMAGIDITTVTYKGTGPLTNDLVGGHVTLAFNTSRRRSAISRRERSGDRGCVAKALGGAARCANRRGGGAARLRSRALLRDRGAGRHAAPDHRAHQQGNARDHRVG